MTEQFLATAPVARRTEVTLVRRWLGFESAPRKFIIAIVPPRISSRSVAEYLVA